MTQPKKAPPTYYGRPMIKRPTWSWFIPLYFFLGGIAGGGAAHGAGAAAVGGGGLVAGPGLPLHGAGVGRGGVDPPGRFVALGVGAGAARDRRRREHRRDGAARVGAGPRGAGPARDRAATAPRRVGTGVAARRGRWRHVHPAGATPCHAPLPATHRASPGCVAGRAHAGWPPG